MRLVNGEGGVEMAEGVKQVGGYGGSKEMRARASGGGYEKESSEPNGL